MNMMERPAEIARPEENIRVSINSICSIRMPDGRYLLMLNSNSMERLDSMSENESPVSSDIVHNLVPIGGAYHRAQDRLGVWDQHGFIPEPSPHPEERGLNLRGYVPMSKADGFIQHIREGRDREVIPLREITEELNPILKKLGSEITHRDLIIRFRKSFEETSPSLRPSVLGERTRYLFEVFDVDIINDKVVQAVEKAVAEGMGLVLVTPDQIRNGGIIQTFPVIKTVGDKKEVVDLSESVPLKVPYKGRIIDAAPTTLCNNLISRRPVEAKLGIDQSQIGKAWEAAKKIAFFAEGKIDREYRLTLNDINMLKKVGDPKLVDDLEKTIVIHRLALITAKVLGGVSEGYMVSAAVKGMKNMETTITEAILPLLGVLVSSMASDFFERGAVVSVSENLEKVLDDIAVKYSQENSSYGVRKNLSSLEEQAGRIAQSLGQAEEAEPILIENLPSLVFISKALWELRELPFAFANLGYVVAAELILRFAIRYKGGSSNEKIARRLSSNLVASFAAYLPLMLANVASKLGIDVNALNSFTSIGGSSSQHIIQRFTSADEMMDGETALANMRRWIHRLTMTIGSKRLLDEHKRRILLEEDRAELVGSTVMIYPKPSTPERFRIFDEVQDNIPHVYPSVYFHDYTVSVPDEVFVESADMYLSSGKVHMVKGKGRTICLNAFADKLDHPKGSAYLRLIDRDINLHGEREQMVGYFDCSGKEGLGVPTFAGASHDEVVTYLKSTDLFDEEELQRFRSGDLMRDRVYRARLWIAYAGWVKQPVIILDDPLTELVRTKHIQKVIRFLASVAKRKTDGKVVLISLKDKDSKENIYIKLLENSQALGDRFVIEKRKFRKLTQR